MKTPFVILSLAIAASWTSSAVQAQPCAGGGGWGYDYGYLYNSLEYNVPYFAAHPPVYYSYPVPRTYGYSPFAYPPNVMTPEVADHDAPVQIINPYVPSSNQESPKSEGDRTASTGKQTQPLVIINPYVPQSKAFAQAER